MKIGVIGAWEHLWDIIELEKPVWNLLKRLHDKGYLYKGHTIQPFSPWEDFN